VNLQSLRENNRDPREETIALIELICPLADNRRESPHLPPTKSQDPSPQSLGSSTSGWRWQLRGEALRVSVGSQSYITYG